MIERLATYIKDFVIYIVPGIIVITCVMTLAEQISPFTEKVTGNTNLALLCMIASFIIGFLITQFQIMMYREIRAIFVIVSLKKTDLKPKIGFRFYLLQLVAIVCKLPLLITFILQLLKGIDKEKRELQKQNIDSTNARTTFKKTINSEEMRSNINKKAELLLGGDVGNIDDVSFRLFCYQYVMSYGNNHVINQIHRSDAFHLFAISIYLPCILSIVTLINKISQNPICTWVNLGFFLILTMILTSLLKGIIDFFNLDKERKIYLGFLVAPFAK